MQIFVGNTNLVGVVGLTGPLVEGQVHIVSFTVTASQAALPWSETVRAQTGSSCTN